MIVCLAVCGATKAKSTNRFEETEKSEARRGGKFTYWFLCVGVCVPVGVYVCVLVWFEYVTFLDDHFQP